jgi:hypothetical protein
MHDHLESLKSRLDAFRPFNPQQQAKIDDALLPRRIQYTNTFGDSTLTLEETRYFLDNQRMVGGKLEREFDEIKGVHDAILFLRALMDASGDLSVGNILKLHQVLTAPISQDERYQPGQYRIQELLLLGQAGSRITFPPHDTIANEMNALMDWYHQSGSKLHLLDRAARFHYRFSRIHPFVEANGRIARLLDDFILEKGGYGPALVENREKYFNAMRVADQSVPLGQSVPATENADISQFIAVMGECCAAGMQMMLEVLEDHLVIKPEDLEARMEIFDRVLAGKMLGVVDLSFQEAKETSKLAIAREVGETLKDKVHSRIVQFNLAGPAKFQHNNHQFSPLIAEVTERHNAVFEPSEVLYEYHFGPDLNTVEESSLPVQPFMKILSFAILSYDETVGIFSGVLNFEFGRVYIKQINRNELILKLLPESVRELTGKCDYQEWNLKELKKFIYNSLDNYFHEIEEDFLKATGSHTKN